MKLGIQFLFGLATVIVSAASFADPLRISTQSGTTLPSTVIAEGESFAYYEVKNLTSLDLTNNVVKILPDNVAQITDAPYCGETFNLQRVGTQGDNCVLKLSVTGEVKKSNAIEDNIYVCLSDKTTCVGTADKLDVKVVSALAVGQYSNSSDTDLNYCYGGGGLSKANQSVINPLLMQRTAGNWTDVVLSDHHLPEDYYDYGFLGGISCAENFCAAGGLYAAYIFSELLPKPLLALSPNGAGAWNYDATFPNEFLEGYINTVSCADNYCVMGGSGCELDSSCDSSENSLFPAGDDILLATSSDGYSWEISPDRPSDYDIEFGSSGYVVASGCNDNECIIGGSYEPLTKNSGNSIPLVGTTSDGINWDFPITARYIHSGYTGTQVFLSVSCSDTFCLAGGVDGTATNASGAPLRLPLLAGGNALSSSNSTWAYKSAFMTALNSHSNHSEILGVNCYGELCVVVGQYGSSAEPLLITSSDGFASHWNYFFFGLGQTGRLNGVSCFEDFCVAVGDIEPATNNAHPPTPFIVQSEDGGETWNPVENFANIGLGELYNVSCSADICTAAGVYEGIDSVQFPLIAQTTDQGNTWTVISELPDDFTDSGVLVGVSSPGAGNPSTNLPVDLDTGFDVLKLL